AILPRLATPLGPLLLAAARGALDPTLVVPSLPGAAVGIVLASAGYPGAVEPGAEIPALDRAGQLSGTPNVLVFHSGTRRAENGTFLADGGRVLTVVARGRDVAAARLTATAAAERIAWPGAQWRRDIGGALEPVGVPA
ncbi:MAG TPA: phosphoribosylglycinamide synthetase C domain-containing protein, partial [Candidatus Limnocylindrales bacterium]|nr:phosphoribosylglycinamide synthetase C domain-containing protein [Candidatus Limnocylindrales bacterium]